MLESLNAIGTKLQEYSSNVFQNKSTHTTSERIVFKYEDVTTNFDEYAGILIIDVYETTTNILTKVETIRKELNKFTLTTPNESIKLMLFSSGEVEEPDLDFKRWQLRFEVTQYGG